MSKNCIGIFYLINGRIVSEKAPVSTVKASGALRAYPRQHHEFWSELQKKDSDISDLNCYALPRGRVLYNEKEEKFEILADRHILEEDRLQSLVIQGFHLEKSDIEFKEDENYRCSICEND